jgi:paired amphipathic helix protein Sin3a
MLFQGNPELIQGFNTFLPPGYHIQCSQDPHDSNKITVTTPMGTLTQPGNAFNPLRFPRDAAGQPILITDAFALAQAQPQPQVLPSPAPHTLTPQPPALPTPGGVPQFGSILPLPIPPVGTSVASRSGTPLPHVIQHLQQQGAFAVGSPFSPGIPGGPTTNQAATFLGGLNAYGRAPIANDVPTGPGGKPQATDFNTAIQFLNQIKTRFTDDPNTYKQFLEILQSYQKDQRALQDVSVDHSSPDVLELIARQSQVHAQVQVLFKDAPELIEGFMAFLPGVTGAFNGAPAQPSDGPSVPHPPGGALIAGPAWEEPVKPVPEPVEPARTAPKRKRKPAESEQELPPKASSSRVRIRTYVSQVHVLTHT